MDKHKEIEILFERLKAVEFLQEVAEMKSKDSDLLNDVYKEISETLGIEVAMSIYGMFKGQQISFPVRFFNPAIIRKKIVEEYDGSNVRALAVKYDYSEKTVRRIIKESLEADEEGL